MKKLTLTIVCAMAVSGAAFGQGIVLWSTPSSVITAQTNAALYCPLFFDGGRLGFGSVGNTAPRNSGLIYYYELLYNPNFTGSQAPAPDAAALFGGTWLDTGLSAINNSLFSGILSPINSGSMTVPWASGVTNNIMLVGWSANLGTSWLVASNNLANWDTGGGGMVIGLPFFGESAVGYLTPATSPAPGAAVFGSGPSANGLPINNSGSPMQLYIIGIPEPGTIALVGLGGLSLFLFRRRK